ncbi:hypothetical protein A0J48_026040 [Sphaerospermopsis aphanizomenoides BCCUSP55]|uniref:hypothetical protein n=1 Tax=Sphaerospermopsis aphanizomenoides TaxID=459663 RepID=UPI000ACB9056|nr:hypothetical protein [Sphaerospermopsis aphanizomenoides]MBK1990929.1 hypothetical protein [Sphaerospermopsis aphanizomenoides BCCUSP55]
MKKPSLPVQKILIATATGLSFASLLTAQPSWADTEQTFSVLDSDKNSNPLTGNSSGFDMLNMIHQANFGTLNWNSEQQSQQIDEAAAEYQAKLRAKMKGQQQQNPSSSTPGQNSSPLIIFPSDK